MAEILSGLAPARVFHYFEEICGIPHGSDNISPISDYLVRFAKEQGLWYVQEPCGNVIMRKPATAGYEDVPGIILQGHMDMVAVQDADCTIDMMTQGLSLYVESGLIGAKGTSLGGDDGIALAYAMAILEANDISHPAIEFVATINEETGMDGAQALDASVLSNRRLLNIDSEEEGTLLVGCAGGLTARILLPKKTISTQGTKLRLTVSGLQGGHSGTEIHKNRANAILLLAQVVYSLVEEHNVAIVSIFGGTKDNVIPSEATAILCATDGLEETITASVKRQEALLHAAYVTKEPGLALTLVREGGLVSEQNEDEVQEVSAEMVHAFGDEQMQVFSAETTQALLRLLTVLPFGVAAMSADLPGLVETSNNIGILAEEDENLVVATSIRSLIASEKELLFRKIRDIGVLCGATVRRNSEYPGWQYRNDSPLRDICVACYKEQYGEEPIVQTIHAGLECGLLIEKMPDLDAVSLGPNIYDIHTTKERLDIASTERTWKLLLSILAAKE